jgi:hypothetical protein
MMQWIEGIMMMMKRVIIILLLMMMMVTGIINIIIIDVEQDNVNEENNRGFNSHPVGRTQYM